MLSSGKILPFFFGHVDHYLNLHTLQEVVWYIQDLQLQHMVFYTDQIQLMNRGTQRILLDYLHKVEYPHKVDSLGATYEDRYAMVELACAIDPRFEASRLEDGSGPSYSIDTVEKVRGQAEQLFFIIGADAFAEITTWHRWRDLLASTDFIVVTRPGHLEYPCPEGARVHRLDTLALPVSSSDIRQQLMEGRRPEALPPAVAEYILARGLYQESRVVPVNATAE